MVTAVGHAGSGSARPGASSSVLTCGTLIARSVTASCPTLSGHRAHGERRVLGALGDEGGTKVHAVLESEFTECT